MNENQLWCLITYKFLGLPPDLLSRKLLGWVFDNDDGLHDIFKRQWNRTKNNETKAYQIKKVKFIFQFIQKMLNKLMEPLMPSCSVHAWCTPNFSVVLWSVRWGGSDSFFFFSFFGHSQSRPCDHLAPGLLLARHSTTYTLTLRGLEALIRLGLETLKNKTKVIKLRMTFTLFTLKISNRLLFGIGGIININIWNGGLLFSH